MRITLHPDWKRILTRAWSMRLNYAQMLYSGVDASLSYLVEGRVGATIATFLIGAAIAGARIVKQQDLAGE